MKVKKKMCHGCDTEQYIWKRDVGVAYCKNCWGRIKAKEPAATKVNKPLAKKSQKMKEKDVMYSRLRKIYLDSHPMCEVAKSCCTGMATEIHHTGYRGTNHNKVETWKASCSLCHKWIHAHPREARKEGLLL